MLAYPQNLSLIVTHRCTAACDHCCFGCSPEMSATIPEENLMRYIDQATEIESIRSIVFTGGECFLLGDALDRLVKRATGHGFSTRFVSNGYWAISKAKAMGRLGKLVEAGLKEANFSTGDMHGKYVRPEYVRNGAIAAAKYGLNSLVMVEMFQNSSFDMDKFVSEDEEFAAMVNAGDIILNPSVWMPFSGTTKLSYSENFTATAKRKLDRGCSSIFNVLAINPEEDLITCCGLTQEQIPELHIGSLKTHTIKQLLRETPDDFIKIWIHLEGPQALIEYARRYDDSIPNADHCAHICHACRVLYDDARVRKVIREHPPIFKQDLIRRYYDSVLLKRSEVISNSSELDVKSIKNFKAACTISNVKELMAVMQSPGPGCCAN